MLSDKEKQIFAILFASGEPVEIERISLSIITDRLETEKILAEMSRKFEEEVFPVQVLKLDNKYQLVTHRDYSGVIKQALDLRKNTPLSQAAMEVLAIVAYNQPVTKNFVEQVRGVDSGSVVNSLVEKGLVEEYGRLDIPGRPIAYKTGANFLRCFGMDSLEQLPEIKDEENKELTFNED